MHGTFTLVMLQVKEFIKGRKYKLIWFNIVIKNDTMVHSVMMQFI